MRRLLVVFVVLTCAGGLALGAPLVVDGDKADWEALGLSMSGPLHFTAEPGIVVITHFGAAVYGDSFYAFMEVTRPASDFTRAICPGAWIDMDRNPSTSLTSGSNPLEWTLTGTDLDIEISNIAESYKVPPTAEMLVSYWGQNGDADEEIDVTLIPLGTCAVAGNVMEWSAPLSTIDNVLTILAGLPYNLDARFPWDVRVGGEGKINGVDPSWGRHIGGPIQVPYPGDANLDLKVDDLDASILAANWQRAGDATWLQGDFNRDGNVNDLDASILAANWQWGVAVTSAVPEPSCLALAFGALAAVGWVASRRRA